jgi:hypothetical protein
MKFPAILTIIALGASSNNNGVLACNSMRRLGNQWQQQDDRDDDVSLFCCSAGVFFLNLNCSIPNIIFTLLYFIF